MNKDAYSNVPSVANPRDVESWALLQSARDLYLAKESPEDKNLFRDSIRVNMLLWTVFQDSVMDDASPLPFEIRNNLLNLSRFVDKHSIQCLATEDVNDLDILISINQNIAAGLAQSPDEAANGVAEENLTTSQENNDNIATSKLGDIEA
ncbi:MAG: flagellar protein FlaF [Rhodospirillaceae bacterium]|nr:flagellar protein FlaF [Rhodospirillaceae bacterium]